MLIDINGNPTKLPDFFLVGAPKCGTTTLYQYLYQHPEVFLPTIKEPSYFCFASLPSEARKHIAKKFVVWDLDNYIKLYKDSPEKTLSGDCSPLYLYSYEAAIDLMKSTYGDKLRSVKIIAILRNPVERAFSSYLHAFGRGNETLSFKEAIKKKTIEMKQQNRIAADYTGVGMYYAQVKAYQNAFPNMKIFLFEDLKDQPALLKNLSEFLGIDSSVKPSSEIKTNPSGIPKSKLLLKLVSKQSGTKRFIKRLVPDKYWLNVLAIRDSVERMNLDKPKMDSEVRRVLTGLYSEDVKKLEELIGRDLSSWRENR